MSTKCFLVVPTTSERIWLRRYHSSADDVNRCPGKYSYHNAMTLIGDFEQGSYDTTVDRTKADWPSNCECGYRFSDDDSWQVFNRTLYKCADGQDGLYTLQDHIPGMMWHVPWFHDPDEPHKSVDEMRALYPRGARANTILSSFYWHDWADKRPPLCVVCPNGQEWIVDQVSTNGAGWEVKGEAPFIQCSPSIALPGYHGWLGIGGAAPGYFTGDIEGRGPMGAKA